MNKIGILLTKDYKLLSLAAILEVFETVNRLCIDLQQEPPFQINLMASKQRVLSEKEAHHYQLMPLDDSEVMDIVLIPAFTTDNMAQTLQENYDCIPGLIKQYHRGASLGTFCTGAFLLGASGLLNGKIATTHVDASRQFAAAFPEVKLAADKTVTEDEKIYTSGGATSSFHLLLRLIQEYCGKEMAIKTAKIFAIDMDRSKQSYFSTFQSSRNHHDDLVAKAQERIESNYHDTTTIEELIKDIPSSRRNMARRFKQVTGLTPIAYLQQTRIQAAKLLLENTADQMTEVIYRSGYSDPKAFRKVFKKTVGMTPSQYREKFQVR